MFVIRFFLVASAVLLIVMVICSGNVPFIEIRENPEFHDLMRMDKAHWPRCLLWHGWLPMLSGCHGVSLWAGNASESANHLVKLLFVTTLLGWFLVGVLLMGMIRLLFLALSRITPMFGLMVVLDKVAGISSSGAGFFADHAASSWDVRSWGQVDLIHPAGNFPSCRGFCSVPGPFSICSKS